MGSLLGGTSAFVGGQIAGRKFQEPLWADCDVRLFSCCPQVECDRESERLKKCPSGPVTPRGPSSRAELLGMLGAGNIRRILPDAAAILVWHAVFSALWNAFKALKDMPAWPPGFFSQVSQPRFAVFALRHALFVCLVNTPHLSQERWLLTGQVPLHLGRTSSCLPGFSICCPHISKYRKCEAVNVRGKACATLACTEAPGVVVRTAVMEIEMLFLFIPPPPQLSLLCLEWVRWTQASEYTWRTVKSTNPPNYAECYRAAHALRSFYGKQKLSGRFQQCVTFSAQSHLQRWRLWKKKPSPLGFSWKQSAWDPLRPRLVDRIGFYWKKYN